MAPWLRQNGSTTIELPGGYFFEDGRCEREVELRPLCGTDEEWLLTIDKDLPVITLTILLLARCVVRISGIRRITHEHVSRLLIVDKDYLLLQLLRASYGDRVEAVLSCTAADCQAKIDMDFDIRNVPIEGDRQNLPSCRFFLEEQSKNSRIEVAWRFPNLADLEWLMKSTQFDLSKEATMQHTNALSRLMSRCLLGIDGSTQFDAAQKITERLDDKMLLQIDEEIAKRSPRIDFDFEVECPVCRHHFTTPFDPLEFLLRKLQINFDSFYREIHTLALWYHWSEAEIMALSREKRRRYLGLVSEETNDSHVAENSL